MIEIRRAIARAFHRHYCPLPRLGDAIPTHDEHRCPASIPEDLLDVLAEAVVGELRDGLMLDPRYGAPQPGPPGVYSPLTIIGACQSRRTIGVD